MQGNEKDSSSAAIEPSSDMGIVGRSISHIFASIDELRSSGWSFVASLELVEIYNETLRDLLAPADVSVRVHDIKELANVTSESVYVLCSPQIRSSSVSTVRARLVW